MRIEVLCPHFAPDTAPTGSVMTAIVEEWAALGHRIDVVTSTPWYRDHAIEPGWSRVPWRTETVPWGSITRVYPFPSDKASIVSRALGYGGFTTLAATRAAASRRAVDAVFAMSPPLTLGVAGWALAARRRAPLVFNVQDIFPDVAVRVGAIEGRRLIAGFEWLERETYRRADAVTVLSEDLRANVAAKLTRADATPGAADKVRVIPNFVDVSAFSPGADGAAYRREFGLGDRIVVMYAGNVGHSQSLGMLVHAAEHFSDRDDVVFVINGEGVARHALRRSGSHLENLVFVDYQPPERLAEVLAAADVHVVPLKAGLASSSVPSKFYSILAAGRPVVAAVDPGSELSRVVDANDLGIAIEPDRPDLLFEAIDRLCGSPGLRARQGVEGRRFVESWLSPANVAARYAELFEELGQSHA